MKRVFADADFLIALLNPKEQLNATARAAARALGQVRLVTSEMVLTEVLAFYADKGPTLREAAASTVRELCSNPNVTIIPQTSLQFQDALSLYRQREDKEWSLTDCASFLIMREQALTEALTHDHHFEQAEFKALLRE